MEEINLNFTKGNDDDTSKKIEVDQPNIDTSLSDLSKFHTQITGEFNDTEKQEEFPSRFYQALLSGANEFSSNQIVERKIFHEDWIDSVEQYFPNLDKITRDPKLSLRYDEEVVAIEKAKKINSKSVRHLSSNTQFIREVRKDNFVIPNKILTTNPELETATYENRFIKTLIDRLFIFVRARHQVVLDNIESFEKREVNFNNQFEFRENQIEMKSNMVQRQDLKEDESNIANQELLRRIELLNKKIGGLKSSPFMETMKNAKKVLPPIQQTNIFQKNVDYKNCYQLYLFLDKFNRLKFDIDRKDAKLYFDRVYQKQLYQGILYSYSTILSNQKALDFHYKYLDINEYQKRFEQNKKKRIDDIASELDPFILENSKINEYYLQQAKKLFEQNLDKYASIAPTYTQALKKAVKDSIAISNAIYADIFDLGEGGDDFDVFRRSVKEDLDAKLRAQRNKARIARIIRETKEEDYITTIREERKIINEVKLLDNKVLDHGKEEYYKEALVLQAEEKAKKEVQGREKYVKYMETTFAEFCDARLQIAELKDKSRDTINKKEKELETSADQLIEKMKKLVANTLNKINKNDKEELANVKQQLKDVFATYKVKP
jgi:hypothetical protein